MRRPRRRYNAAMRRGAIDPSALDPADLAPGDARRAAVNWTGLSLQSVSADDAAAFDETFAFLAAEFAPSGGMEQADVLRRRLAWRLDRAERELRMWYELVVVRDAGGRVVAAGDHSVIVTDRARERGSPVVAHLSHLLVNRAWRGRGIGAWLRALPLRAARACLRELGRDHANVAVAAEVEHAVADDPASFKRLQSFEAAGFRKVDSTAVDYMQPDFRPATEIEATGVRPVPYALLLRRVGREAEGEMEGRELREIVRSLYAMFADAMPAEHMAPLWRRLDAYPLDDQSVRLVAPTAGP